MGCSSCGGGNRVNVATLRWTVDLSPAIAGGKTFSDGTTKKVYASVGEANAAVKELNLLGKIRPRPALPNE